MLTPKFELNQNDEFLILDIKAPFAKISETEIYFQDYEFKFFSKPYFLRLNLPGKVIDNETASAKYDSDKGSFTIYAPKMNPGENFEGLNLLTRLLAPTKRISTGPLIEVLETTKVLPETIDEFSWEVDQVPFQNDDDMTSSAKYGFANSYSGILNRLKEEIPDCVELSNPDDKNSCIRKKEKFETELKDFNEDHYLADLYDEELIKNILEFEPKWEKNYYLGTSSDEEFTDSEKEKMLKFPNKEYLLDKEIEYTLYLGLVDILLAFAYNGRTTAGENTVESAWTISKLSGTLSWLVIFNSLKEVVTSFMRRSLCYPLYRHWNLSLKVIKDTRKILYSGREYVLKCLLELHSLIEEYDSRYILNDLYIMDYCIWIQSVSNKNLISLSNTLSEIKISKEEVKLDLIELEAASVLAMKESKEIESSDSESSSSIPTSLTDSDDYSTDSSTEDSLNDDLDETCSLLTKLRT